MMKQSNKQQHCHVLLAAGMGGSAGFAPVGSSGTPFTGSFDGQNYAINDLFIDRSSTDYVGLFGYVDASTLSNVSVAGDVTGHDYVGGLVGKTNNSSTVSNVTSTVNVTGNANVGGIVGLNDPSTLNNVAASGTVTGVSNVGGVVGWNYGSDINGAIFSGTVTGNDGVGGLAGKNSDDTGNSYASSISNVFAEGGVSGSANTGGVIGSNDSSAGSISYGAWVTDSSGQPSAIGGGSVTTTGGLAGLTLAQTHQQASYVGWDFVSTWRIYEGHTVPLLRSLLKPLTITADNVTKVYDGTSIGLTGVIYSDSAAAGSSNLFGVATPYGVVTKNNVGTYAADIWSDQHGYDITIVGGQLTVTPLALAGAAIAGVTATYGTAAGAGAVSFTNIIGGDAVGATAGIDSPAYSGSGNLKAGSYTQTAGALSGADAGNYSFGGYTTGTANYAVTPLALAGAAIAGVTATYGTAAGAGAVSFTNIIGGDAVGATAGIDSPAYSGSGNLKAGSYTAIRETGTLKTTRTWPSPDPGRSGPPARRNQRLYPLPEGLRYHPRFNAFHQGFAPMPRAGRLGGVVYLFTDKF